jgi:hypothetical protein
MFINLIQGLNMLNKFFSLLKISPKQPDFPQPRKSSSHEEGEFILGKSIKMILRNPGKEMISLAILYFLTVLIKYSFRLILVIVLYLLLH